MTPALAETFGLKSVSGGLVNEVVSGSPAQKAGLQAEDVLVGIDGETMGDAYEAMNRIAGTEPGTTLTLNVIRNQQPLDLDVTIGTARRRSNKGAVKVSRLKPRSATAQTSPSSA